MSKYGPQNEVDEQGMVRTRQSASLSDVDYLGGHPKCSLTTRFTVPLIEDLEADDERPGMRINVQRVVRPVVPKKRPDLPKGALPFS